MGMALLRWWWFIWAVECPWDEATRVEARDFCSWIQLADKPVRPHWRYPGGGAPGTMTVRTAPGTPNPVTGKPSVGRGYAAATVVHCESVLRGFYDFHLQAGPMVNPFPLARGTVEPVPGNIGGSLDGPVGIRTSQRFHLLVGAAGLARPAFERRAVVR
jgi:hypothetical protein